MITFTTINQIGQQTWKFAWTATTAPYRVYYKGVLIDTITTNEHTLEISGATTEPPMIEILDATETDDPLTVQYFPRMTLQWHGSSDASHYRVQEYSEAAWVTRTRIQESGQGYYQYRTGQAADMTTHTWRVIAVDQFSNDSSALSLSMRMVRNPSPPAITMAYDDVDGEVDIAAS